MASAVYTFRIFPEATYASLKGPSFVVAILGNHGDQTGVWAGDQFTQQHLGRTNGGWFSTNVRNHKLLGDQTGFFLMTAEYTFLNNSFGIGEDPKQLATLLGMPSDWNLRVGDTGEASTPKSMGARWQLIPNRQTSSPQYVKPPR